MRVRARARKTDLMAEPTDTKYENRPLRWRWFGSPRTVAVLAASILVVGAIIYGVFIAYSVSLGEEFNKMSAEGMNDFTAAQKIESESSIGEIRNTVLTIRTLAESPDIDPEGEVFTDFLDSWNERSSFGVTYVSIATLEEGVDDSNRKESDREILRRLKAGESVVSDVRKSNRLDGYFYSIAEPVVKDNMVVGVLRSIVDAHTLIDTTQIKSSVTLLGSVLMKGDGTIIVDSEKSELYDGSNLYDVLRSQGYADAIVNKMQENVENDSDVATLAIGKRNGKTTFFTSVRLNENDWTIVNFTEENTIAEHSQVILHDTVVAGTVLVVISTIACIVVALVIGRFRRRALREADRYAVLAEFSDTVLFEYSYSDDVLELTPNARSVFSLDSLRREHYLERGIPLIDFHEEDVSLVGEILENPAPSGEARHAIVRARTLTGEYRWFSIKCRYLYEGQEPYAAVGKMVDITQQRALEEQLVRQSQIDGLTKALNKVTVEEKIAASLAAHDRGLLFMIDVDDFKQINDSNGHLVGDQVLAAIARALFDVFRCDDPVGRVGGDEFVAFARGADEADVVDAKRRALRDRTEFITKDLGVSVSLSIGVARYPHDGKTYQELFDAADRAMYRDKQERDGA